MAAICSTCGNILQADGNFYCAHCACAYYDAWSYQNPQPAAYPVEEYEMPFTQRQEQVQPFNHLLDQPQFASQSMEPHFLQPQQYQTASSNPYGDTFYWNTKSSGSLHASYYVNGNQNQYYAEHNSSMSFNQNQQPMEPISFEAQYMVPNMQPQEIQTAFPDQSIPVLQCKEEVQLPGTAEFGEFQGSWSAGQSQGFQQLNSVGQHPSEHLTNLNNQNVANFYEIQGYDGFSGRENQTNRSNLSKESQNESMEQSQGNVQEETGFRFEATPVPFSDCVDDPAIYENPEWNEELVVEQKEAHEEGSKDSSGVQRLKRKRAQAPQEAECDSDLLKKGVKQTSEKLKPKGGYCAAESCNKYFNWIDEHQFKRKHPRLQKCSMPGCRYFYPSWEDRREHERKKHRERKELRCAHCHYSTENKHHLKSHIKKHFRPPICSVRKTPACPHCEFFSKTSSVVKRHMNSSKHRNEERDVPTRKKFCCSKCEFSSFEITDVTNHIETHHPLEYIDDDNEE